MALIGARRALLAPSYNPLSRAFFARLATQPSQARAIAYEKMIRTLAAAGVWAKLDVLMVLAAADAATAATNLISSSFPAVPTASPTFAADRGYTGDGAASYLKTGYTPSTAGGRLTQDSASIGFWSLTAAAAAANVSEMGASDGTRSINMRLRSGTSSWGATVNGALALVTTANTTTNGLFVQSRTGASGFSDYLNGALLAALVSASTGLPAQEIYALANDASGSALGFSTKQCAAYFIGGGLSAADVATLYSALNAYLHTVGAV